MVVRDKAPFDTSAREGSGDRGPPGGQSEPHPDRLKPPKDGDTSNTVMLTWARPWRPFVPLAASTLPENTHSHSTCCVPGPTGMLGHSREQSRTWLHLGMGMCDRDWR